MPRFDVVLLDLDGTLLDTRRDLVASTNHVRATFGLPPLDAHAVERLSENREHLDSLARALLENETLDERDAYEAAGFDWPPPPRTETPARVAARDMT